MVNCRITELLTNMSTARDERRVTRGRCGALPRQVRDTQRRYGAQKTLCATAGRDTKRLLREVACSAALCAGALPAG
eukprot:COSAG03_NODE_3660_length_1894_cov_1.836212_3_plen_77_part_00